METVTIILISFVGIVFISYAIFSIHRILKISNEMEKMPTEKQSPINSFYMKSCAVDDEENSGFLIENAVNKLQGEPHISAFVSRECGQQSH